MKTKGLLLPVFSLPGKYGIGEFGKEAFSLLSLLHDNGFNTWQILPLNPISYGHSPYQPYSSYAIEDLYLSIDDLIKRGLIDKAHPLRANKPHINYEQVRSYKEKIYYAAYNKYLLENGEEELKSFAISHQKIDEYASFMANKELNDFRPWNEWNKTEALGFSKIKNFHLFKQMLLLEEWKQIRQRAELLGINIIGDLPFYVGYDSSDVYYNQRYFLLNEEHLPSFVAGVSPDYFSLLGQRWGNPIYDFKALKEDNYRFILDGIAYASTLYDIVRLDHFRAFDTYYVIPSQYEDARIGKWLEAPGYEIFDELYKEHPTVRLIAEDLGDLRKEVITLRDHYHLPGMNVLEFNLEGMMSDKNFNPDNYKNTITYIGTHDNMTLRGYIISLKMHQKSQLKRYFKSMGINAHSLEDMVLKFAFSKFEHVVISFTDLMHLNNHAGINTPSTMNEINWTIRLTDFTLLRYYLKKGIQNV